jgi:uncharacterized protein YndB with AHSA1/START domain
MNTTGIEAVVVAEIPAPPERVFRALASQEITKWWVRPGVFDTREWSGDVSVGGRWRSSGMARGNHYTLEGEFTVVEPPRRLAHTWRLGDMPLVTTVSYELEPIAGGTRVTLRHGSFPSPELCEPNRAGWEACFDALQEIVNHG